MWVLGIFIIIQQVLADDQPSKAPRKPKGVNTELYCVACRAIVRELLTKLRHRTKQSEVIDAMDNICYMWNFKIYEYPPPEMRRGCESLIRDFEEEFETALVNRHKYEDVEKYICDEVTKACLDVVVTPMPGADHVTVDN